MSSPCVTCSVISILSLSFHPCRVLRLFLCSCQGKSVGFFCSDWTCFCHLSICKILSANHFGWSVCFPFISKSFAIRYKCYFLALSSPNFVPWKSSNLFSINCVPACCVPLSSSPAIIFAIISYLDLSMLWPPFRWKQQATVSLCPGIHLSLT